MDSVAKAGLKNIDDLVASTKVLLIDDDYYMRKVIRSLLLAVGIKDVHEAANGVDGLETIPQIDPDIVVLDWEMPQLTGSEFMRMLRAPGKFAHPGRAGHHADRACRARARGRGHPPRRQRISLQAGVGQFAASSASSRSAAIRGRWCGSGTITAPSPAR